MVKATVYDITDPACALPGSMFFDTNAWLDLFYPPYSLPNAGRHSAIAHSNFYGRCLAEGVTLIRSSFSFPEIAHVIENDVARTYSANVQRTVRAKQSRRMPNLRRKVVSDVVRAWKDVVAASTPHPGLLADDALADLAVSRYGRQSLDGYDLFVVEQVAGSVDKSILTDDADYLSVSGLKIYTSNAQAINDARNAGRLR